jgi:ATP-binding cassette subfamily B protein
MRKFKLIKQHDSMQCGAACLAMLCYYYGRYYTIEAISKRMSVSNTGVSMYAISESANSLGLKSFGQFVDVGQLGLNKAPCILHWNQNHFVVLYKVKNGNKYYIADPGKGLMTYSRVLADYSGFL